MRALLIRHMVHHLTREGSLRYQYWYQYVLREGSLRYLYDYVLVLVVYGHRID